MSSFRSLLAYLDQCYEWRDHSRLYSSYDSSPPSFARVINDSSLCDWPNIRHLSTVKSPKLWVSTDKRCGLIILRNHAISLYRQSFYPFHDIPLITNSLGLPWAYPYNRFWNVRKLADKIHLPFRKKKKLGRVAVIGSPACRNYFHFLSDAIADWWFLMEGGVDAFGLDGIVILGLHSSWQNQILQRLNLPSHIQIIDSKTPVSARELVVALREKGHALSIPSWLVESMSELLPVLGRSDTHKKHKIFVSRRDASLRKMNNEDSLAQVLIGQGFIRVELGSLGFDEQQLIFANASCIVSQHGAGLANLLWSRAGTRVIEIFPPMLPLVPCYALISLLNDLNYVPVFEPLCRANEDRPNATWSISHASIERVAELI